MRKGITFIICAMLLMMSMEAKAEDKMYITIDGQTESMTLANTKAALELKQALEQGPITVSLNDNDFEIWGALGKNQTRSDEQMTVGAGDVVLYNGSNICVFYGPNSWSYTRLGKIEGMTENALRSFLKAGSNNISVMLSASNPTAIKSVKADGKTDSACYSMNGQMVSNPTKGLYIKNGNKVIL